MLPIVAVVGSKGAPPAAGALTGGVIGAVLSGGDLAAVIVGCITGVVTLVSLVASSRSKSDDAEDHRRDAELERLVAEADAWRSRATVAELAESELRRVVLDRDLGLMRLTHQLETLGHVPAYRIEKEGTHE